MKRLYTPWRMAYIKRNKKPAQGCLFCQKPASSDDDEHIVARSAYVYLTLNRYPYNNGHLMVIPYEHVASQESMSADALTDMMVTVNRALAVLRRAYNPQGFNLGANLGTAAGAGIAEHYHFHIVPRWSGDVNFMTAISETRVIPETLDNIYRELKTIWHDMYEESE